MTDAIWVDVLTRLLHVQNSLDMVRLEVQRARAEAHGRVSLTDRIRGVLLDASDPLTAGEVAARAGSDNEQSVRTLLGRLTHAGEARRLKSGWVSR